MFADANPDNHSLILCIFELSSLFWSRLLALYWNVSAIGNMYLSQGGNSTRLEYKDYHQNCSLLIYFDNYLIVMLKYAVSHPYKDTYIRINNISSYIALAAPPQHTWNAPEFPIITLIGDYRYDNKYKQRREGAAESSCCG